MNKKIIGTLGLASVALVGGTFAYFTQTSTIDNPFNTASYSTVITEDFKPEDGDKWEPGAEVNKDLYVDNTGDRDVVVRVKFQDLWTRDGVDLNTKLTDLTDNAANKLTIAPPSQIDSKDGLTEGDGSVVWKFFSNEDDWYYNENDGYFYYKHNLKPGSSTGKFLDSVKLDKDTDMGKFMTQFYWTDVDNKPATSKIHQEMLDNGWIKLGDPQPADDAKVTPPENSKFTAAVTTPEKGKLGYSSADYTLRITIESVQATDNAVFETFGEAAINAVLGKVEWNLGAESLENQPSVMPQD